MDEIIESVSDLILELEIVKSDLIIIKEEQEKKKSICNELIYNVLQYIKWKK